MKLSHVMEIVLAVLVVGAAVLALHVRLRSHGEARAYRFLTPSHAVEIAFAAVLIGAAALGLQVWLVRHRGNMLLIAHSAAMLLLGVILVVFVLRGDLQGPRRWFLLTTGLAAVGFPVGVGLHNALYTAAVVLFGDGFWRDIGLPEGDPVFSGIGLLVSPAAFLVGVAGTCVTYTAQALRR